MVVIETEKHLKEYTEKSKQGEKGSRDFWYLNTQSLKKPSQTTITTPTSSLL